MLKLFNFQGRIGRATFWWSWILSTVAYVLLLAFIILAGMPWNDPDAAASKLLVLGTVAMLPLSWFSWSIGFKRMQDTGRHGAWTLLSLIPLVGLFVLIYLGFVRGTEGSNEWGEPNSGGMA